MTKEQLRAARAILGISVKEFSEIANVATRTISRFETGQGGLNMSTHDNLKSTLENMGVQFLENGDVAKGGGAALKDKEE